MKRGGGLEGEGAERQPVSETMGTPRPGRIAAAGSPLATVPTLDAIAACPELVRELPHQVLFDLAFTALRVQAALHLALAAAPPQPVPRADDDLLTVDQAAAILKIGKSTLEHGARTTYKTLRVEMPGRGLRFSRLAIQKWIQRHKAVS